MDKKPNDFKSKAGVWYPGDHSKPSTSGYGNQYYDMTLRDRKCTEAKKRSHSPDNDQNRDYNPFDQKKIKVKDQFPHQQRSFPQQVKYIPQMPQMNPYPNYGYNVPGHFNMESNQRNYAITTPYNMYSAVNTQWPCNQVDSMCMPSNNMQVNAAPLPASAGMHMASNVNENINGFNSFMPMANDMYNMRGIGSSGPYPMHVPDNMAMPPVNKTITLPHCVLTAPHPGTHIRTRERYPGCKTVLVGRLPENITEELIREIFGHCGEIATVRMSKKNFCYVRFAAMEAVDKAMMLSGYRLKIENKEDNSNSGDIQVDFARSREDIFEWKVLQRARDTIYEWKILQHAREQKNQHRECLKEEATCPPTPPPVVYYSEHEANLLSDRLRNEETFKDAIHVLITWLDRGDCNRKTCGNFYSMIHCSSSHIKRLVNEKKKLDEVLNKAKLLLEERTSGISLQFNEIIKLFNLVKLPNIWDNFNTIQKKSIDFMRQTTFEIIGVHSKEVVAERVEVEMDLSDDDCVTENPSNSSEYRSHVTKEDVEKIKAEMENLKNQLKAVTEEKVAIQREKEKNHCFNNTLLHEMQEKVKSRQAERDRLCKEKELLPIHSQNKITESSQESENNLDQNRSNSSLNITENEIGLLYVINTFLSVHPFGASIQYICSYLQKIDPTINDRYVKSLMQWYPNLFEEKVSGIGASSTKTWVLVAYYSRR